MMTTTAMTRRFLAVLLLCFLPGCFTILTQIEEAPPGPRLFSGTWNHFKRMASGSADYWSPAPMLPPWMPLDFPLSLAADIVILPYTIPTQLIYGNFKEKEEEAPATRKAEK